MKIGDLYYKGKRIADLAEQSVKHCEDDETCDGCLCEVFCQLTPSDLAEIEIELPPIIKAVDAVTQTDKADVVNHPSHYETGKFECIEVMTEALGADAVKDFCICNAFKYLYRFKRKNGIEDVKKAKWYINKYLEMEDMKNY